jgi:hypothetical protein
MAELKKQEIEPGIVAFLGPTVLSADPALCHTQDPPVTRAGPFLCVAAQDGTSSWSPVTTEWRRERLELRAEWRSGGHPQWLKADQYLNDGANLWQGPDEVFVAASYQESTGAEDRARLSAEGLAAVEREIDVQAWRRDRDCV